MTLIFIMLVVAIIAALCIVIIDNYYVTKDDHYIDLRLILAMIGVISLFWSVLGFFIV